MSSRPRIGESLGIRKLDILHAEESRSGRRGVKFFFSRLRIGIEYQLNHFFDTCPCYFKRLPLRIATRKLRYRRHVPAVLILLDEHFKLENLHRTFHKSEYSTVFATTV